MPDDLYERDILAWSQRQADLLRRLGRGERVNDVDWANIAEKIDDLGLSELHAVEGFLNQIIVHLLKLYLWPEDQARNHCRSEIFTLQRNAKRRFSPSMRQRINVDGLYADAADAIRALSPDSQVPAENPFTVDPLLEEASDKLLTLFQPHA